MGITFNRLEDRVDDDEATMQFYDANGKRVSEDSGDAVVQYLSNDPARPDANRKADKAAAKAKSAPDETKAVKAPDESK